MAKSRKPLTASQSYEEEAAVWEQTGELQRHANNAYLLLTLRCWLCSSGATFDGVSDRLRRYNGAASKAFESREPGWYDALLNSRGACSVCGETYHVENLSSCTHCDAMIGYCHYHSIGKAANGNPKCPRCSLGELAG